MRSIVLRVPCIPFGQPRQKHRKIKTSDGREFTHNYTPTKHPVNAYKAAVQLAARDVGVTPMDGPIRLSALFLFPRPKRLIWKKKPMPREWHTARPDRDNVEKATMDALSKIAWFDDTQVCAGPIHKMYCAGDEAPQAVVKIRQLPSISLAH